MDITEILLLMQPDSIPVIPVDPWTVFAQSLAQEGVLPGWWKYNELSGTVVENYGYASDAGDAVWTVGTGTQNGDSYTFDGAASKVAVPSNAIFRAAEFTIAVLAKPTGAGESSIGAFFNYADAGDTAGRFNFSSTVLTFSVGATGTGQVITSAAGANLKPTIGSYQWTFFELRAADSKGYIFKGFGGVVAEYVYASQTAWTGTQNPSAILCFGNNNTAGRTFAGDIRESLFINRLLTADEKLAFVTLKGV